MVVAIGLGSQFFQPRAPESTQRPAIDRAGSNRSAAAGPAPSSSSRSGGSASAGGGAAGQTRAQHACARAQCGCKSAAKTAADRPLRPAHANTPSIGLARRIDDANRPAEVRVVLLLRIDAQARQTVASRSGTVTGLSATVMASSLVRPLACPPRMPPPASTVRPGVGEVVAAGVVVDLRRAAELAHPDDQRRVEQAAGAQIFDQAWPRPDRACPTACLTVSKLSAWVSQPSPPLPPSVTSTNGTPARPTAGPAGSPGRNGCGRRRRERRPALRRA